MTRMAFEDLESYDGRRRTTSEFPQMTLKARPRIAVIGTGGTIGSFAHRNLDYVEYLDGNSRKADVTEVLAAVPELQAAADVQPVPFRAISSSNMTPKDWLGLAQTIEQTAATEPCPAGIVITHGTSTLEETAYFLNLTLKVGCTVALVGAQRPFNTIGSDAQLNLLNAVRVAGAPAARGLGVLVLLNDEIHGAREVTKASNHRLQAFRAPELGMLGFADGDGTVAIYRRPLRRQMPNTEFDVRRLKELPRVDITYSYVGVDGTTVEALVAAGAKGIVAASLPPGSLALGEKEAFAEARRKGVAVVLASRAHGGRVPPRAVLRRDGIVAADNLSPQKARILLMLALTKTNDPVEIGRIFSEY